MFASSDITAILKIADVYRAHRGVKLSTCSLWAAKNGALFKKLSEGKQGLTIARRDRIIGWFDANWPADLPWPDGVPRPSAERQKAAS